VGARVKLLLRIVRALLAGQCWRLANGRTLWPLWGFASRRWAYRADPKHPVRRASLPWWLGFYGKASDRFGDLFAALPLIPFFWFANKWKWWRWCLEDLGIVYGWFDCEEGGYYSEGRWAGIGEKFPTIAERAAAINASHGITA
jgi:hypothetical protein